MMYTIKDFKVGDFKDQNGNTWCQATFAEHGEPVIWVVKDPSKVTLDTQVEGEIRDWTSAKGKTSPRFYRTQESYQNTTKNESADKPYFRDATTVPLDVWRTLIGIQGVPENPTQFTSFFETVQLHANELLSLIENVREGKNEETKTSPIKEKLADSDWTKGLDEPN